MLVQLRVSFPRLLERPVIVDFGSRRKLAFGCRLDIPSELLVDDLERVPRDLLDCTIDGPTVRTVMAFPTLSIHFFAYGITRWR